MLSIAAVFTVFWIGKNRSRLSMPVWAVPIFSVLHVIIGVLFVRVFAFLESAGQSSPGAMSLFGAVFFMPAAYFAGAKIFKRKTSEVFDIFSIGMILTLFCARINCLASGCCLGRVINGSEGLRWPTREAELVYYVIFLVLMIPRVRKGVTAGRVYPLYMLSYGCTRALLEIFRESSSKGIWHISHIWAFISIAIGASVYIEIKNRKGRLKKPAIR